MIGPRAIVAVSVAAGMTLTAAGCGGGGKAPSVASLAPSHGGTTTSSAPAEAAPSTGGGRPQANAVIKVGNSEKFSECMRSHGVPNFPDPSAQGVIQFGAAGGIDPSSPKFEAAAQACRKVLPNGGQPSPQQIAKAQHAALKFSACMRSHGIKDFPDPNFSGGGVQLRIGGKPGSDLDPNSPLFQKAQAACQGLVVGKFGIGPGGK